MFCPFCGTKIADDSLFCENCGKRVQEQENVSSLKQERTQDRPSEQVKPTDVTQTSQQHDSLPKTDADRQQPGVGKPAFYKNLTTLSFVAVILDFLISLLLGGFYASQLTLVRFGSGMGTAILGWRQRSLDTGLYLLTVIFSVITILLHLYRIVSISSLGFLFLETLLPELLSSVFVILVSLVTLLTALKKRAETTGLERTR